MIAKREKSPHARRGSTHSHFTDGILRAGLNYKFY
jgi:hypothetical protein